MPLKTEMVSLPVFVTATLTTWLSELVISTARGQAAEAAPARRAKGSALAIMLAD